MSDRAVKKIPAYFLSIGGPNSLFDTHHPSYRALGEVGLGEDLRAVVVISAHWQSSSQQTIDINFAEDAGIIYDFYGFPQEYHEVQYPYRGDVMVAEQVKTALEVAMPHIEVNRVCRGLDHGVWAGFATAFHPVKNPLQVPIVQVSLFGSEDIETHYRMGQALECLRNSGILIIGAGMAVHNLNDYRTLSRRPSMPYSITFDEALKDAMTTAPEKRWDALKALTKRADFRQAHPTLEHALPFFVAAGAAGQDVGEQVWTMPDHSLSWAQYRFAAVSG